jgi:hypothetical protein
MAVSTYILSIEDFQNRADITVNIQTAKLKGYIGVIQEQFAVKILCQALYDQMLVEIAASTLTTANTALLPYLKDYLIYKTYSRYLLNANAMSTPGGIRVQSDATSEPASDKYVAELMRQSDNDANFYQDKLVNFLDINYLDYPLWKDTVCDCNKIRTVKGNSFSKIGSSKGKVKIFQT